MRPRFPRHLVLSLVLVVFAVGVAAQEAGGELPDLENTGVVVPWSDFKTILADLRVGPEPTPTIPA